MKSFFSALGSVTIAIALSSCGGGAAASIASGPTHAALSVVPGNLFSPGLNQRHVNPAANRGDAGIYVAEFAGPQIYGYATNNQRNRPPKCAVAGTVDPNDIAVDGSQNLIVPDGSNDTVLVFKGPAMCGASAGSFGDPYGQPVDAASRNALTGIIAVANIFDGSGAGSISICTLAKGCTLNLRNPEMYKVDAVAMNNAGDCWASAYDQNNKATLTYFAHCKGKGSTATGYRNGDYGGLDIDSHHNIVSLSAFDGRAYIYSGCKPACTLVAGPFPLHAAAVYGHLNHNSTKFATGDFKNGAIDVYDYSESAITYKYNFTNGLGSVYGVEGAAYTPRSKE